MRPLKEIKEEKNLVIMGVGEEEVGKTKDLIGYMLEELLKEDIEFTVIGRVGKADGVKIKPLICVEDTDNRRKILKSASTLKDVNKFGRCRCRCFDKCRRARILRPNQYWTSYRQVTGDVMVRVHGTE